MKVPDFQSKCLRLMAVCVVVLFFMVLVPGKGHAAGINTTDPANGDVLSGVYTVAVNDDDSATRCELSVDGSLVAYMDGASPDWSYGLDTRGWSDGGHLLTFKSIGGTGGDDLVTVSVTFDNHPPLISGVDIIFPAGQTAAKQGDSLIVTASIADSVTGITSAKCNASEIASGTFPMIDDGRHHDGQANDGAYGTHEIMVNTSDGYYNVMITATDGCNNTAYKNMTVGVDDVNPTVTDATIVYPIGQSAAKQGDRFRVLADVTDKAKRIPVDVVLSLDNSGSMAGQPITDLVNAANTFISYLIDGDRLAVYCFEDFGMGNARPSLLLDWTYMDASGKSAATTAINFLLSDTGHNTPIWDAIYDSILKAYTEHLPSSKPIVIAMTDGGNNRENLGVVTPQGPWPPYDNDGNIADDWATPPTVRGICEAPISVYTIGLNGGSYSLTNGSQMREIAESSNPSGIYYFAPDSSQLDQIYSQIAGAIVTTGPNGITRVYLNGTKIGSTAFEQMYDDGMHGDGFAGDELYGSELMTEAAPIPTPTTENLQVTVVDIADNTDTKDVEIVLDNTPPAISGIAVQYPAGNSVSDGQSVKFIVSASDGTGVGVSFVTLNLTSIGGSSDQPTYVGPGGYETQYITVSTGNLTGVFTVWAFVKDKAGNLVMQSANVNIDNTHLQVSVNSPAPVPGGYQYISGIFVFRVGASAPSAVGSAFVTVFGNTVPLSYNPQSGYFENTVDTSSVPDGDYTISATFYDALGRQIITPTVDFRVDNAFPVITVNYPQNGAHVEGYNLTLNITATDLFLASSEYNIDGNPWQPLNASINTTQYLDGTHTVTVRAMDDAGHVTTTFFTIVIDNSIPVCALNSPVGNQIITGDLVFRASASDFLGISKVTLTVFSSTIELAKNTASGYYEYPVNTNAISDGVYNATVTVYDTYFPIPRVVTFGPVFFTIDNSVPALAFDSPFTGRYIGADDSLTVNITASDTFLVSAQYRVDGGGWVPAGTPLNTSAMTEGTHTIYARAFDLAGHTVDATDWFILDKYPPVCALSSPNPNEFVSGHYVLRATATDYVGLDSLGFTLLNTATNSTVRSGNMTLDPQTGYFVYPVDTTTLEDEIYELTLTVKDKSGKTATATTQFYIFNDAPGIFLSNPKNNDFVDGPVDIYGNVTYSDRFLISADYVIDDGKPVAMNVTWDTTAVSDGYHDITVRASYKAGKTASKTVRVIVDNNPPACEIVSPVYVPKPPLYQFVSGIYTFKVFSEDAVGLKSVNITVFGTTMPATYNPQSGYYEYTIDTKTMPGAEDGVNDAVAQALDLSGKNATSATVHFNLDNNAPIVSMLMPRNGMLISGPVPIELAVSGEFLPTSAWYDIDGNGWQQLYQGPNGTTLNSDKSKLSDGEHTLGVMVTDLAKHSTVMSIKFIIQNSAPVLSISAPNANEFLEGTYMLRVSAADPVGMVSVNGTVESGAPAAAGFKYSISFVYNHDTGYYEYPLDTTRLSDGNYNLTVRAKNQAWESVRTISFSVDNTFPELQINSPLNGAFVSGKSIINVTASDAFLQGVQYDIDHSGWTAATGNGKYAIVWDTTAVTDGEHALSIKATDKAGHSSEQGITVNVDNTRPTAMVMHPVENEFISGVYVLAMTASDASGVKDVRFTAIPIKSAKAVLTGTLIKNPGTLEYEYSLNTSRIQDGRVRLNFTATDAASHTTNSSVDVIIDNTPPTITVISPKSGNYYGGVDFSVQTKDSGCGVKGVELYIDSNRAWVEMLSTGGNAGQGVTYTYTWFTELKDNGVHTFEVRTMDKLGNVATKTSTVSVGNVEQKDYLGMVLRVLPLIVFIFIVLLLVLLLVLLKRGTLQAWVRGERRVPAAKVKPKKKDEDGKGGAGSFSSGDSEMISSVKNAKIAKGDEKSWKESGSDSVETAPGETGEKKLDDDSNKKFMKK